MCREGELAGPHPPPLPRITITEVALTIAVASRPGLEPELLDRVAGDRRGDQERPGLDLDQPDRAVDLDRAHDPGEAIAGRELVAGAVALRRPAEPAHLGQRDEAPVALVARRADLARAIPAPQGVGADADHPRRFAEV